MITFQFTEEQNMIRDMVREFTKKEVEPRDKWMDENGFDYDLHKKLTQAGLMGIHLAEKYGGGGGDAVTSIIVIHELAKGSASVALFLDANWLAADLILYHGSEAQKDKYLPLAAQGKIFAFGLTESSAGSDAADGGPSADGGHAAVPCRLGRLSGRRVGQGLCLREGRRGPVHCRLPVYPGRRAAVFAEELSAGVR